MALLMLLENEVIDFPFPLVDVVRFIVYMNTSENFTIQLNQRCMLGDNHQENRRIGGQSNVVDIEL